MFKRPVFVLAVATGFLEACSVDPYGSGGQGCTSGRYLQPECPPGFTCPAICDDTPQSPYPHPDSSPDAAPTPDAAPDEDAAPGPDAAPAAPDAAG